MRRSLLTLLAISALFTAGMWLYVSRVLVTQQKEYAASHGIPRGNLSDFYPRWLGSRELLLNRRDPYSPEVTEEIQSGYYGRPLDPARPNDPRDQQAFAYPVYVAFLLAPTINLPFAAVQETLRWLLAGLTVLSVLLWLRVLRWRPSWIVGAIMVLLTLATFPAVQGIRLQQLSLLVAALIAGCIYLLTANLQILAGVLLALATIKPQLALPLAAWLMSWSGSRLHARWKFATSFVITFVALIMGGEILLPGWIHEFYAAILAYRSYTRGGSVLEQPVGPVAGAALTVVVVIAVALACWRTRKSPAKTEIEYDNFCRTTALVLAATVVIVPTTAPYNQLLLLPGTLLIARTWNDSVGVRAGFRVLRAIAAACVIWPWISATSLALASFVTPAAQRFWQLPLWTSLLIPLPLAACVALHVTTCEIQPSRVTTGH
jgi:Glycosyltransferase family 87